MAKLTGATNWQGSFIEPNGNEDQIKAGHFGIELQTKGKYLDKNIQIDYVPPTAVFNVNEDKTTVQTGGWIQAGEEVGKVNAGTAKSNDVTINNAVATINNDSFNEAEGTYDINISGSGKSTTTIEPGYITSATDGTIGVSGTSKVNASTLTLADGPGAATLKIKKGQHAKISQGYYSTERIVSWDADELPDGGAITGAIFKNYIGTSTKGDPIDKIDIQLTIPEGYYSEGTKTLTFEGLIPDFEAGEALSEQILTGYQAYDEKGQIITGAMPAVGGNTDIGTESELYVVHPSVTDQTLGGKTYYKVPIKIEKTTLSANLTAANVKYNQTVEIGCADDPDRIASITGTFTAANTVTGGATAVNEDGSSMLVGTAAFLNGVQVTGTIETYAGDYNLSGNIA